MTILFANTAIAYRGRKQVNEIMAEIAKLWWINIFDPEHFH